ncbi:hypothetical protein GDO81_028869 [Engystomops pustulosus]|uniref:Taste receptor type 2 member 40 n=1 Tax=Engystomops pustulosus TaxID=76066 RepID=A0AAV6ZUX5_ENGPU|nr:hypothetical protein GDO81_028869 [Engystomops pustulosus]
MACLVGFTVNLITVAANSMKWKSQRSLQTCDKIVSHLAISRGLYLVSVIFRISIFKFFPRLLKNYIFLSILYVLNMFLFHLSHWIVTVLCVFYCVRIVTYNCALCVFLRSRISTMVPWLVTTSLIMSLLSSLPLALKSINLYLVLQIIFFISIL